MFAISLWLSPQINVRHPAEYRILFVVVVAACFHTKANLKAVFPRHQNNSGDKERLIYQKAPG
jgi:hypothetical protein